MAEKTITPEKKGGTDWVVPVALVGGGAALGVGLWFYMKKPQGIDQGDDAVAKFKFHYEGASGQYILQVSLGHVRDIGVQLFDHIEGLTWTKEVELPESGEYEFTIPMDLPAAITPGIYDGEALIRLPGSDWLDYVTGGKLVTKSVITIREP